MASNRTHYYFFDQFILVHVAISDVSHQAQNIGTFRADTSGYPLRDNLLQGLYVQRMRGSSMRYEPGSCVAIHVLKSDNHCQNFRGDPDPPVAPLDPRMHSVCCGLLAYTKYIFAIQRTPVLEQPPDDKGGKTVLTELPTLQWYVFPLIRTCSAYLKIPSVFSRDIVQTL